MISKVKNAHSDKFLKVCVPILRAYYVFFWLSVISRGRLAGSEEPATLDVGVVSSSPTLEVEIT